jgi:3-dehydroshikimate dehydratase
MIFSGLCSLTLAESSPAEIVALCVESQLTHIEWWGKAHVPAGDLGRAREVGDLTRAAGLKIATYGSYYRVGESESQGLSFDDVRQTAVALQAPAIRVWAGTHGSDTCSQQQRAAVIADTMRIADLCAGAGVDLVFEYHGGSLTDCNESAVAFAAAVQHPSVFFGWQPPVGISTDGGVEGLRAILPGLATIHVFNWLKGPDGQTVRRPLGEAVAEWREYFDTAAADGRDHVALLEFVKDNSVEQFLADAKVLRGLLNGDSKTGANDA